MLRWLAISVFKLKKVYRLLYSLMFILNIKKHQILTVDWQSNPLDVFRFSKRPVAVCLPFIVVQYSMKTLTMRKRHKYICVCVYIYTAKAI
jgi:hypothetical protein